MGLGIQVGTGISVGELGTGARGSGTSARGAGSGDGGAGAGGAGAGGSDESGGAANNPSGVQPPWYKSSLRCSNKDATSLFLKPSISQLRS